jgi:glycosyltransferase involved in cell wall biosynthesis
MSNAMLEALVAGVPVLSTPVSGAAEALEPLADGRVPGEVVDASEEALAARLRALLADPAALAAMGAAARARARERFAWTDALERWERVLAAAPLP